jgi:hypothetical protein
MVVQSIALNHVAEYKSQDLFSLDLRFKHHCAFSLRVFKISYFQFDSEQEIAEQQIAFQESHVAAFGIISK